MTDRNMILSNKIQNAIKYYKYELAAASSKCGNLKINKIKITYKTLEKCNGSPWSWLAKDHLASPTWRCAKYNPSVRSTVHRNLLRLIIQFRNKQLVNCSGGQSGSVFVSYRKYTTVSKGNPVWDQRLFQSLTATNKI